MPPDAVDQLCRLWDSAGLPADRWPEAVDCFGRFWTLIQAHNARAGLTAAGGEDDFRLKHVADSLAALCVCGEPFAGPGELADVGSGAGLPGLILAVALPELRLTAVESNRRKADFIELAANELGLGDRVEVVARRSREIGHDQRYARRYRVVTARAVAPADKLIRDCRLLIAPGGSAVFYKTPPAVASELPLARREAARHGLTIDVSDILDLPGGAGTRQFLIISAPA